MITADLQRFRGKLAKAGPESGPFTPRLFSSLATMGHPTVCMDARRAAAAIKCGDGRDQDRSAPISELTRWRLCYLRPCVCS
jgi:hypothetical protein